MNDLQTILIIATLTVLIFVAVAAYVLITETKDSKLASNLNKQ